MPPTDPSERFESTASYYARYRPDYGDDVIDYLRDQFALDESVRVLDLGCGTGQLTVPLAAHAGEVVAVDPNESMLHQARARAYEGGRDNVEWLLGSDSDLSDDLGTFRLTTMGRSFHWMDQERTLERLYRMTEASGGVALVTDSEWFTKGEEPWQDEVYDVAAEYVDDLPDRTGPIEYDDPWSELIAEFGFGDVEEREFKFEREWTVDGIVGYVLSLSFCSPKVLDDDRDAFETDLRARLGEVDGETFVQRATVEVIAGRK